jgi:hypothetical protein
VALLRALVQAPPASGEHRLKVDVVLLCDWTVYGMPLLKEVAD